MIAAFLCCSIVMIVLVSFGLRNNETKDIHFNHLAIYVYDLKVSTDFYKKILQLEQIDEPFKDNRHSWFNMGPHSQLHIIGGNAKEQQHIKDTHLSLSVSSLENFAKHLDELNIPYGDWSGLNKKMQKRADDVHQVYFQDPDGYWIEMNDDKY